MAAEQETFDRIFGDEETGRAKKIAFSAVAACLALAAVWLLFTGGDDPDGLQPVAVTVDQPSIEEDAAPVAVSGKGGPVETFQIFAPKDPLDPLVEAAPADAGASAAN